jgi:hypothetical protein
MLLFKAYRKSPALTQETTPSQRRITRILSDAQQEAAREFEQNLSTVAELLSRGQVDRVVAMLPTEPWLMAQEALAAELLGELLDAGSRVTLPAIEKATLAYSFDRERPESSQWARHAAGMMISQITGEQRDVVRDVVSAAALGVGDWGDVAQTVRGSIGLTTQQAGWVSNHYDRAYLTAIRSGMGTAQARARARDSASRYQTSVHRYRANTIARTETMRAASEGRMQAWNQGLTQGFISPLWRKEWVAEANACEICRGVGGKKIGIKESFPVGEPPAHPNCRCDVVLIPSKSDPASSVTGIDWGGAFSALSTLDDISTLSQMGRYTVAQIQGWRQAYDIATEQGDSRSFGEWFEDVIEPDITVYADEGDGEQVEKIPDLMFELSDEDLGPIEQLYKDTFFTEEQKDAIWEYQDDGWSQINSWLRSGQLTEASRNIQILDSIFAMAPQWGTTGWPVSSGGFSYFRYIDEELLAGLKVGDRLVDDAYMYTSVYPDVASEYGQMADGLGGMRIIDSGDASKISLNALTGFTGPLGDPEVIFYRGTPLTFLGTDAYGWYVFRAGAPDKPPGVPDWMDTKSPYMPDRDFKELGSQYSMDDFRNIIHTPTSSTAGAAYDALVYYRGDGYLNMNYYMRGEFADYYGLSSWDPYDPDNEGTDEWDQYFKIEEMAQDMSELFERIPGIKEGIRVWRGFNNVDYLDDLTPGATFFHESFMSTSLDRAVATGFGSGGNFTLLRINAPAGVKALIMPGTLEKEVLFPPGTVLKFVKTVEETINLYGRNKLVTVIYAEVMTGPGFV